MLLIGRLLTVSAGLRAILPQLFINPLLMSAEQDGDLSKLKVDPYEAGHSMGCMRGCARPHPSHICRGHHASRAAGVLGKSCRAIWQHNWVAFVRDTGHQPHCPGGNASEVATSRGASDLSLLPKPILLSNGLEKKTYLQTTKLVSRQGSLYCWFHEPRAL